MSKTSRKKTVEFSAKLSPSKSVSNRRKKGAAGSSGTKSARVITLLSRPDGATIAELMKMTGWQAHSIRGFLSGSLKKQKGLLITRQKDESGVTRYGFRESLK